MSFKVAKIQFLFTKDSAQKYKGNIIISVFFAFFVSFLSLKNDFNAYRLISLMKTVLLIPILAYVMTFYDVSCVIKWHFMTFNYT